MRFFVVALVSLLVGQAPAILRHESTMAGLAHPEHQGLTGIISSLSVSNCEQAMQVLRELGLAKEGAQRRADHDRAIEEEEIKTARSTWVDVSLTEEENEKNLAAAKKALADSRAKSEALFGYQKCRQDLVESGYIGWVTTAMKKAPMDADLQSSSCENIYNLCTLDEDDKEYRLQLANQTDVIQHTLAALHNAPNMTGPSSATIGVYQQCVKVLTTFDAWSRDNADVYMINMPNVRTDIEKASAGLKALDDVSKESEKAQKWFGYLKDGYTPEAVMSLRRKNMVQALKATAQRDMKRLR